MSVRGMATVAAGRVSEMESGTLDEATGARITRGAGSFALTRVRPAARTIYYTLGPGRLDYGDDLATVAGGPVRARARDEILLSLIHGVPLPPDATHVPGVHRLALGTTVRVEGAGITVDPARTAPARTARKPARRSGDRIADAVAERLPAGDLAIGYSGGLASAFLAVCAGRTGPEPRLLHQPLAAPLPRPVPSIPTGSLEVARTDLADLVLGHQITGRELLPPLPDVYFPARALAAAYRNLVLGGLFEDLFATTLLARTGGRAGARLLTCEPFHGSGRLRGLAAARRRLDDGEPLAREAGAGHVDEATPHPRAATGWLPGLTPTALLLLINASKATPSLWREHLAAADPTTAALEHGHRVARARVDSRRGHTLRPPPARPARPGAGGGRDRRAVAPGRSRRPRRRPVPQPAAAAAGRRTVRRRRGR